jgi:hypothetical protein
MSHPRDSKAIETLYAIVANEKVKIKNHISMLEDEIEAKTRNIGELPPSVAMAIENLKQELQLARQENKTLLNIYVTLYDAADPKNKDDFLLNEAKTTVQQEIENLPQSSEIRAFLTDQIMPRLKEEADREFKDVFEEPEVVKENEEEVNRSKIEFLSKLKELGKELEKTEGRSHYVKEQFKAMAKIVGNCETSAASNQSIIRLHSELAKYNKELGKTRKFDVISETSNIKKFLIQQQKQIENDFPFLGKNYKIDDVIESDQPRRFSKK